MAVFETPRQRLTRLLHAHERAVQEMAQPIAGMVDLEARSNLAAQRVSGEMAQMFARQPTAIDITQPAASVAGLLGRIPGALEAFPSTGRALAPFSIESGRQRLRAAEQGVDPFEGPVVPPLEAAGPPILRTPELAQRRRGVNIGELVGRASERFLDPAAAAGLQVTESPLGDILPGVREAKTVTETATRAGVPEALLPTPRQRGIPSDVVNPITAALGDENEQRQAQQVLEEAGLPRALASQVIFDPLNVLPGVGFTKASSFGRALKAAAKLTGTARVRAVANLERQFPDVIRGLRAGEEGVIRLGGDLPEGAAGLTKAQREGVRDARRFIDELQTSGFEADDQLVQIERHLDDLDREMRTRAIPFRGRFRTGTEPTPQFGDPARKAIQGRGAARKRALERMTAQRGFQGEATEKLSEEASTLRRFLDTARFEDVPEPSTLPPGLPAGEAGAESAFRGAEPTLEDIPGLGRAPARRNLAGAPPPPKPPRPPTGRPRPDPDDPIFDDLILKGEKPEEALMRRHQGAIDTAAREAEVEVQRVNESLRQLDDWQDFRGTVVPKPGKASDAIELHRYLHNPSKVASGEMRVPERFRPIYDKVRDLTDWEEAARIDFDPEMATVQDYMYRGWKPPDEAVKAAGPGGRLGSVPGFKKPRVDAPFDEMVEAGFEPLFLNPAEQWRYSRMMGVKHREQTKLVQALKDSEQALPHDGGPIPEGWRVPKVGPAFEGKPFAITDEAGDARPMFTRRWIVPDSMANRLENIYGVQPKIGKVELLGKTIDVDKAIDAATFIPKRFKLFTSFFQHFDFLNRSHSGAWTGMVDALRRGQPINSVKHLARWPNSARKVLTASVNPKWRQSLREWSLSTDAILPERPSLSMRKISEAGLSLRDETILPTDIDNVVREAAEEALGPKAAKALPRTLGQVERIQRQNLFQGVYPAAILTDIQNNIAPIVLRRFPDATDEQLAGMIARAANTKYSTIPASMSVVQNRVVRKGLTRLFFSLGENEGLLRQATGALRGPQAAFWRTHWLGTYIGLIAAANTIHFASTGQPLPFARYSPISKNKWGPLPFGYNRDFAAPNIPLTGRSGTEVTLDLVGQMDTALRILDPKGFIAARESVPVRTALNQLTEQDFFGAPIDTVGPEGIVSRTAQLVTDLFAPIGFGQAALQEAREKISLTEKIIPPGEDRLGQTGTLVQGTGANLRAETTPQLLDRIRGDVMREQKLEGDYESLDATQRAQVDGEVERRIGGELEMRRETAELRGQATPAGEFFEQSDALREEFVVDQEQDDAFFNAGTMKANVWKDKYRDRARSQFDQREGIKRALGFEFADREATNKVDKAVNAYWDVNVDDHTDPQTGETDWDDFFEAREQALEPLSESERIRVEALFRRYDTETVREFKDARKLRDELEDIPRVEGVSLEAQKVAPDMDKEVDRFRDRLAVQGIDPGPVTLAQYQDAARKLGLDEGLAFVAFGMRRQPKSVDYLRFLFDNQRALARFYPELYDSREVLQFLEPEIAEMVIGQ